MMILMRRDIFLATKSVGVANVGVRDVVRPEFNNKFLSEIFTISRQLADKVLELDANMERNIKFKTELITLLSPYEETQKQREKKTKQTSIKRYFVSSNTRH
jgi:hypothetical protein